jgi:gamma-glutamyl-gamma-aminobutyrate hydrolase PuuD
LKIAISVSKKEKAKGALSPYFGALVAAGARPEELELVAAGDASRALESEFDGVLFTGGEDVDPALYDEKIRDKSVRVDRARDEFESALLDRALEHRLPILGICRGMQMIDVKFGGSLYQDLPTELSLAEQLKVDHKQDGERTEPTHAVTVTEPESRLGEVFSGSCRVNSLHHQAIKRVGRGLKVTAYSEDGLPEAVEAADEYPFLLAVQWHPEEMVEHAEQLKIFEKFLAKCREEVGRRSGAPAGP